MNTTFNPKSTQYNCKSANYSKQQVAFGTNIEFSKEALTYITDKRTANKVLQIVTKAKTDGINAVLKIIQVQSMDGHVLNGKLTYKGQEKGIEQGLISLFFGNTTATIKSIYKNMLKTAKQIDLQKSFAKKVG
ncbi:MAG TPA: hypothetical protein DDW90_07285 [Cyanobacteria bacterium UBA9971]|nr:hypothetical protein [Cyanobacteria bacterium UBA9971]